MTFYEELQLNQAGSKALIKSSTTSKERNRHILIYLFKILLTLMFCFVFVTVFSMIFGHNNGTAGVVLLLFLLAFRKADLGIKASHGASVMLLIFGILIVAPHLANMLSPGWAFFVHLCSIFALAILGCHQVQMYNQATIILSYLLLFGYDVQGTDYLLRILGLGLGGIWTACVLYRNHKSKPYTDKFLDIFRQFRIDTERSRWQIGMALTVSSAVFVGELLSIPRVMWIGFAALSVTQIAEQERKTKAKYRFIGVLVGAPLVLILLHHLPAEICGFIGVLGGLGVGFSAHYGWQTIFNCFGAVYMATAVLGGTQEAVFFRIVDTGFGILYALIVYAIIEQIIAKFGKSKHSELV